MLRKKAIPTHHHAALLPALLVSLLAQCGAIRAAEAAPATQYAIEQPSQSLADSLQAIAHETSTSVLFDPGAVRGRVAHPVSGRLSAFEAITAAIQGTGLVAEQMKDGAVVVRPAATPAVSASGVPVSAAAAEGVQGSETGTQVAAESARDDSSSVTKVEITGTRLKRINAEGPAPVNVYTRKDIEQSGQPNLERFLSSLNEVSASTGEGSLGSTVGQGTVQLRGLPLGSTLVLINGRRVEAVGSSSANFFNLNLIPVAAIERVEIVPVGSSAVYGGDALAGVVNVILKKSIDGFSVAANLGAGRGFGDGGVSLATGGHDAEGSFLGMASYSRASPLTMAERGFFRDADYRRFGGPDTRSRNCTPGTVRTVPASNPYNPFGQDVKVTATLGPENGLQGVARQTRFTRALAGVRGDLTADWESELTISTTRDNGGAQEFGLLVNDDALAAALGSSSPATALNPFTPGRAASDDVLHGISSDDDGITHGREDQVGVLVRGSLLQLPAGSLDGVLGAETARDRFDASFPAEGAKLHGRRSNSAVFGELRAPLLNAGPTGRDGWNAVALTVAARRDRYSDFGSANTYQAGLELRPLRSLLFRASTATSFKPPTLLETHVFGFSFLATVFSLVDPARGGEPITSATIVRATNKELEPEHGRASSFGAVWEPEGSLGTRLSATHWQVRINDLISIVLPQTTLDNEALFPRFITRGPSELISASSVSKVPLVSSFASPSSTISSSSSSFMMISFRLRYGLPSASLLRATER